MLYEVEIWGAERGPSPGRDAGIPSAEVPGPPVLVRAARSAFCTTSRMAGRVGDASMAVAASDWEDEAPKPFAEVSPETGGTAGSLSELIVHGRDN